MEEESGLDIEALEDLVGIKLSPFLVAPLLTLDNVLQEGDSHYESGVDLKPVINLVNNMGERPVETISLLIEMKTAIEFLYKQITEIQKECGNRVDRITNELVRKYKMKDAANPLWVEKGQSGRITNAEAEAFVQNDYYYLRFYEVKRRIDFIKSAAQMTRDCVQTVLDFCMKILPVRDEIPLSGVIIGEKESEAVSERFELVLDKNKEELENIRARARQDLADYRYETDMVDEKRKQ